MKEAIKNLKTSVVLQKKANDFINMCRVRQ